MAPAKVHIDHQRKSFDEMRPSSHMRQRRGLTSSRLSEEWGEMENTAKKRVTVVPAETAWIGGCPKKLFHFRWESKAVSGLFGCRERFTLCERSSEQSIALNRGGRQIHAEPS